MIKEIKFDPSMIQDTFAKEIEWTPLISTGEPIKTHSFKRDGNIIKTTPTLLNTLLNLYLLSMASIPLVHFISSINQGNYRNALILLLITTIFLVVILLNAKNCITSHVFDLESGYYWKTDIISNRTPQTKTEICSIYAIQVISDKVTPINKKGRNSSYELNLVLNDKSRINITNHIDHKVTIHEAKVLAEILEIPYWIAV